MFNIFKKIPVHIDPFFWLMAIFIGFLSSDADMASYNEKILGTLLWVGIIVFSVLFHEYGHALTAITFGQSAKINLMGIGGITQRDGKKLKLWQEFLIVLNGPLCSIILAFGALFAAKALSYQHSQGLLFYVLQVTANVNFFWTIINILPVQPLDGGRLLSIVLEAVFGIRGVKAALFLSIILASLIGVFFIFIQFLLASAIFFMLAFESYRLWRASLSITKDDEHVSIQLLLEQAKVCLRNGHIDEATSLLEEIRNATQRGVLYFTATQYLAHILYQKGHFKEAVELLKPLSRELDYDGLQLLQQSAYHSEEWTTAVEIGKRMYQMTPSYETALYNALSYSLLRDVRPAVGWLECAIRDGMPNVRAILSKSEFDAIRYTDSFQSLVQKKE